MLIRPVLSQLRVCRELHVHLSWSLTLPWTLGPQAVLAVLGMYPRKAKAAFGGGQGLRVPHITSIGSVNTPLLSLGWVLTPSLGNYPDQFRLVGEWLGCSIQILGTMEAKQHQGRKMPDLNSLITAS